MAERSKLDAEIQALRPTIGGTPDVNALVIHGVQRRGTGRRLLSAMSSASAPLTKRQRRDPFTVDAGDAQGSSGAAAMQEQQMDQSNELEDLDAALAEEDLLNLPDAS